MIANISPACICFEETLNTLKYASRAANIRRKIVANRISVQAHISQYKAIIGTRSAAVSITGPCGRTLTPRLSWPSVESLKSEVESLRAQLAQTSLTSPSHLRPFQSAPILNDRSAVLAPLDDELSRTIQERELAQAELMVRPSHLCECGSWSVAGCADGIRCEMPLI